MILPEAITPAEFARRYAWGEKRVRREAKRLGACHIMGNRMVLLREDVEALLEATKQCPSKSIDVREALSTTTAARLPEIDSAALLDHLTRKPRRELRPRSKTPSGNVVSMARKKFLTFPKAAALYIAAGKEQRFIAPLLKYWKDAKIKDMTPGAIRQSAIEIYPKAGNATRNRQVIVPTQAIINHAAEAELCPAIKVKRFKFDTKIKKPVTLEWIKAFRAHADRADVGVLALFMFATGARISEALGVQWEDIDIKGRKVLIRQSKLGNERIAHLPRDLMVALANLPRQHKGRDIKPFNFAGHSAALKAWERAIEAAGIEPLTFHSCRHGFATGCLRKGIDPVTTAKLGGWKSPAHVF